MSIKRYTPKYKILSKLKQPLWLEKKGKIKKFSRQKWSGKDRIYFSRKLKIYDQDLSTCVVGNDFDNDKSMRLRGSYKYVLQDKQAFQLYYGSRRFRFYQLKFFARVARELSKQKKITPAKAYFHMMENRVDVCLYRLDFVFSLMQARSLLSSGRVKLVGYPIKNSSFSLTSGDLIRIDDAKLTEILGRYIRSNHPFFYFRKRTLRLSSLHKKNQTVLFNFLERKKSTYMQGFSKLVTNAIVKLKS